MFQEIAAFLGPRASAGIANRPCPGHPCAPSRSGRRCWPACFRARCDEAGGNARRTPGNTMHPMVRELFLPAGADLLAEEEETRRAVNRARRARSRRQAAARRVTAS